MKLYNEGATKFGMGKEDEDGTCLSGAISYCILQFSFNLMIVVKCRAPKDIRALYADFYFSNRYSSLMSLVI